MGDTVVYLAVGYPVGKTFALVSLRGNHQSDMSWGCWCNDIKRICKCKDSLKTARQDKLEKVPKIAPRIVSCWNYNYGNGSELSAGNKEVKKIYRLYLYSYNGLKGRSNISINGLILQSGVVGAIIIRSFKYQKPGLIFFLFHFLPNCSAWNALPGKTWLLKAKVHFIRHVKGLVRPTGTRVRLSKFFWG